MSDLAGRKFSALPTAVVAALLLCLLATGSRHAVAQSGAEAFIQQGTGSALSILKDKSLGDADRHARIENLMASLLDLKRMALFTLGPAVRTASPADVDAFVAAYHDFALANYSAELSGYMGQTIRISGSTQRAPGDYIVNATVTDPNDKVDPPIPASFRVLDEGNGKFALVDASVEGVWFTLAQRDDFAGFLGQNGGDISKLITHLKDLAAHPQTTAQKPG